MNNARFYKEKQEYILTLNKAFAPLMDFGSISYAHVYGTEQEYIRVGDTFGNSKYLDITASDFEHILMDVMMTVVGERPKSLIMSRDKVRQVASLFRRA